MKKKNRGFTLVELLAVIIIMAILIVVSSSSILSILQKAKQDASREVLESLKDTAITYVLENNKYLTKCSQDFSRKVYENNDVSDIATNESCIARVTVEALKNAGLFEDSKGYCNDLDTIIVYRYTTKNTNGEEYSEYKAYANETTCSN